MVTPPCSGHTEKSKTACRFRLPPFVVPAEPIMSIAAHHSSKQGSQVMNTILITTQIVCYSVGIVSASLNIASFVRVRRIRRRRHLRLAAET